MQTKRKTKCINNGMDMVNDKDDDKNNKDQLTTQARAKMIRQLNVTLTIAQIRRRDSPELELNLLKVQRKYKK